MNRVILLIAWLLASSAVAAAPATRPTNAAGLEIREYRLPNTTVTFTMVKLPAGSVEMPPLKPGDKPQTVQIKPFWIGQTEVTWDEFDAFCLRSDVPEDDVKRKLDAFMLTNPSKPYGAPDYSFGHAGHPALSMTSQWAQLYCCWLSINTGHVCRLATEAEWEYACIAGRGRQSLDENALKSLAWYKDNSEDDAHYGTRPVGKKQPNAWGLYDMLGNAAEWVVGADGDMVLKGGSYKSPRDQVTPAARQPYDPSWQSTDPQRPKNQYWLSDGSHVGMRIVMEDWPATGLP